jgi:hypothetical protein
MQEWLKHVAQQFGCSSFIIQTDRMQVFETMQDGGFSATDVATIVYDYQSICGSLDNV